MRKGEKRILIGIGLFAVVSMGLKAVFMESPNSQETQVPFYSTATKDLSTKASSLIRKYDCRDCHTFWGQRDIMRAVPAPTLNGIGSLKTQQWLMDYLSAENPQSIVPTRLKKEFQMPSYSFLSQEERTLLAEYLASLKVKDWYLEEAKKNEYEKLTGKTYKP